jgi:hypothetical protein
VTKRRREQRRRFCFKYKANTADRAAKFAACWVNSAACFGRAEKSASANFPRGLKIES